MSKIRHLTNKLHYAREQKGLSQQALCARVGLTQSHLSNIEKGKVDLKASSLIELARALDLEVMLVPRTLVGTVQGLGKYRVEDGDAPPAYRLGDDED